MIQIVRRERGDTALHYLWANVIVFTKQGLQDCPLISVSDPASPHLSSLHHSAGRELIGDCSPTLQHDTVNIIQASGHQSPLDLGTAQLLGGRTIKHDFRKSGRRQEGIWVYLLVMYVDICITLLILPDLSDSNQIFLFTWKCFIFYLLTSTNQLIWLGNKSKTFC